MKTTFKNILSMTPLVLSLFAFAKNTQAVVVDGFPESCAYASDREPLDGHILRLGFVGNSPYGWSFFFPDRQGETALQRVDIAENVGVIGQDPEEDLSDIVHARTPSGSFMVAQIFVGDPSTPPTATCISRVMPLTAYQPSYFGPDFRWLDRGHFGQWLRFKKYKKTWRWERHWGSRFNVIRTQFRRFKDNGGWKKFDRARRSSDDGRRGWRVKDTNRPLNRDNRNAASDAAKKITKTTRPTITPERRQQMMDNLRNRLENNKNNMRKSSVQPGTNPNRGFRPMRDRIKSDSSTTPKTQGSWRPKTNRNDDDQKAAAGAAQARGRNR